MPTFENYLNKDVAEIIADKDAIVTTDAAFRVAVTADGGFYESYFMSIESAAFMVQTASLQTAALVKEDGSVQTGQLLSQVPQSDILRLKDKTLAVQEAYLRKEDNQEMPEGATSSEEEDADHIDEKENVELVSEKESKEPESNVQETTIEEELYPILSNGKDAFMKALYINAGNKDHAMLITDHGTLFELNVVSYEDLVRVNIFLPARKPLISVAFFRGDNSVDAVVKHRLSTVPPDSLGRIIKEIFE